MIFFIRFNSCSSLTILLSTLSYFIMRIIRLMIQNNTLHRMFNWWSSTYVLSGVYTRWTRFILNSHTWSCTIWIHYLFMILLCILCYQTPCYICVQACSTFINIWCQRRSLRNHVLLHRLISMLVSVCIFLNTRLRRVLVLCYWFYTS